MLSEQGHSCERGIKVIYPDYLFSNAYGVQLSENGQILLLDKTCHVDFNCLYHFYLQNALEILSEGMKILNFVGELVPEPF